MQDNMTQNDIPPLLQNALNLVEQNLNNSFAGHVSDILRNNGVNMNHLWKPTIDMIETDNEIIIYMCIPGVSANNIDVDFFNNQINIKGSREFPSTEETITSRRQEIIYGNFERKITLPMSVTRRDSVSISITNGILNIKIDKRIEMSNRFTVRPE